MTHTPPVPNIPHIGSRRLPDRADRDWILSTELITEAGITYRQLDYWTRTGLLTPDADVQPIRPVDHGSGWPRAFSLNQLHRASAIKALLNAGVSLQTIREHIDQVVDGQPIQVGAVTITVQPPAPTQGDAA